MSYVAIDSSTKIAAIRRYWQCNNLKKTAEEFGISRGTLYEWIRVAEAELDQVFRQCTPGKRTTSLKEENEKLRSQLRDVLDVYHNSSPDDLPAPAVSLCTGCGGTDCVRNGRVQTQRHGLRQRYLCRGCGASFYVEVKKTMPVTRP